MSDAAPTRWTLTAADGRRLVVSLFQPPAEGSDGVVILIFPAMGAPVRAYRRMADHLSARGHVVITADPRGVGASEPPPRRGLDYGVDVHLDLDWPAFFGWARERYSERPLVALGHSLGGQLSGLYAGLCPGELRALVLLTTGHVDHRNWGFPMAAGALAVYAGFAALARLLGYLPGHRLGWGSVVARQVVLDWARWGISGRFAGSDGRDFAPLLARVSIPVLSISFSDDRFLGPKRAVDDFCARMPGAEVTRWHLRPADIRLRRAGHFHHLKQGRMVWDRIDKWIREEIPSPGSRFEKPEVSDAAGQR
ncbi:MAG: alpha/beta fold hydrolase [bacterium]|nr:alpha/beta fold hydrolase [bacterium]